MATAQIEPSSSLASPLRVHAVLWNTITSGSVAYALTELLENLPEERVDRSLWCLNADGRPSRDYHRVAFPRAVYRALCRARITMPVQGRIASEIALRAISAGDIVYIWPPYDLSFIKRAQDRGAIVIAERTNCMDQMCKDVLSRAYARRGFRLPDGWCTPEAIAREKEQMLRCDFVTAANALVAQSLRDSGVPDCRILGTSYGFDAKRLAGAIGKDRPTRIPVFAFVGLGIIRKGLDVLLEAWERADIPGKLLIAGRIDQEIRQTYASTLARPDVEELGFVEDVAGVYASADVFVFPTHEEGGPQVIYEAAACGLASVVSPMGAGRIVRDQEEGIIVDPLSVDDLSQALTKIACDEPFRRTLGRNAEDRARSFKWSDAGERLFEQFTNVVGRRRDSSADQFGL